ncbi:MAG: TerC family protein [Phycisphaerae bacterium]|nr:TerC family protein [Phycisphaerae bacterium]
MADLFTLQNLIALVTLTSLEIVLGIDNIVFIAILTGRLPEESRAKVRRLGLLLAMGMRIVLLLSIFWVMKLTAPLFTILEREISGKDLVLLVGGAFLIAKATREIHDKIDGTHASAAANGRSAATVRSVLIQIVLLDIVFSLDSVITAVGMADAIWVMIAAVMIAVGVMMIFAGAISRFVERHPSIKMLALSFLIMIGALLVAEGFHQHFPRGYVYFAMAFSLVVELLNIRAGARRANA